jgi:hypothetical protein
MLGKLTVGLRQKILTDVFFFFPSPVFGHVLSIERLRQPLVP